MINLSQFRFRHRGADYRLDIEWDDHAFDDGQIWFGIVASQLNADGNVLKSVSASVSVSRGEKGLILRIDAAGMDALEIPLDDVFDEGQVINRIPPVVFGGDPITGCLLRAGLSVIIGQIISCKNLTVNVSGVVDRLTAIARCLREHIPGMCARIAWRAATCVVRAGL